MKKVGVGSKNEVKIKGVYEAYKFFNINIEIIPIEVKSGVSKQPKTLIETIKGAYNRACNVCQELKDVNECIGIESGIVKLDIINKYVDITIAIILDRENRISVGISPGFEIPMKYIHEIYSKNIELEDIVGKESGIDRIGEKGGFISYLSEGKIDRVELVKYAVIMALIPRLSPIRSTYGFF